MQAIGEIFNEAANIKFVISDPENSLVLICNHQINNNQIIKAILTKKSAATYR